MTAPAADRPYPANSASARPQIMLARTAFVRRNGSVIDLGATILNIIITNVVEGDGMRYTVSCSNYLWGGEDNECLESAEWAKPGISVPAAFADCIRCVRLNDGDSYQAEIENKTMWIMVPQVVRHLRGRKQDRVVKIYTTILDISPVPAK